MGLWASWRMGLRHVRGLGYLRHVFCLGGGIICTGSYGRRFVQF